MRLQAQRQWLRQQAETITAAVTLIGSGSVLLGAPSRNNTADNKFKGYCSGDDWDCYRPAQQNLIAELARMPGCVVVLTGDYHTADIKRILPGEQAGYTEFYVPSVRARHLHGACLLFCGLRRRCHVSTTMYALVAARSTVSCSEFAASPTFNLHSSVLLEKERCERQACPRHRA